jgi:alpha-L-fucosidase
VLTHIEGNAKTRITTLGYKAEMVEYKKNFDAGTYLAPTDLGLVISAVNGHRMYTNNRWPNSVVLRIENATFRSKPLQKTDQSNLDGAK